MFKFSLEPLLNLQRQREEMTRSRLAQVMEKHNLELAKLTGLNQDLEDAREQSKGQWRDGSEFRQNYSFLCWSADRCKQQQAVVDTCQREVIGIREELMQFRLELKKLERLRNRSALEFEYAQQRQEQTNLDEVAQSRFGGAVP